MAWLILFFYVFFWIKTSSSFAFSTFGSIIRDTRINADNPIEESYTLGWMGAFQLAATFYTYYLFTDEHLHIRLFSAAFLFGAIIHLWHYSLLADFHTEPTSAQLEVFIEV